MRWGVVEVEGGGLGWGGVYVESGGVEWRMGSLGLGGGGGWGVGVGVRWGSMLGGCGSIGGGGVEGGRGREFWEAFCALLGSLHGAEPWLPTAVTPQP